MTRDRLCNCEQFEGPTLTTHPSAIMYSSNCGCSNGRTSGAATEPPLDGAASDAEPEPEPDLDPETEADLDPDADR